jgi:DsbC/DsbD-like thiol-disulfide interchange protein
MTLRLPVLAVATFVLAASASAQDPVKWTATQVADAAPGGKASVKLVAAIEAGWHVYSLTQGPGGPNPTRITVPDSQEFTLSGDIKADAPDVKFDENFGINVETYESSAEFMVPLAVAKTAKVGTQTMQIKARYQVCNATMCLPPKTAKLAVDLKVKKGSGKSAGKSISTNAGVHTGGNVGVTARASASTSTTAK